MKTPTPSVSRPAFGLRRTPSRSAFVKTLAALVPLFAFTTFAHATPLLSENFENSIFTVGTDLNGKNGWTANAAVDVVSGGLSYSNETFTIAGGTKSVQSAATAAPLANTTFTSQTGEVWMSFTLLVKSSINGDRYWFSLGSNSNINTGFNGTVGNTNTGDKKLGAEARTNSSAAPGTTNAFSDNQIILLVARVYSDGTASTPAAFNHVDLWINPASTTLGAANSSGIQATSAVTSINSFALTALTNSGSGPTLQWDNLLIGTTQADVLNVYAIPEPSTYAALGGVAALGLAILHRRRLSRA